MSYNRQGFSVDLPGGLGNGHPTTNIRKFILGWIAAEFDSCDANCDIGCANNPLSMADHTSNFPGTTLCNNLGGGFGVLNFPSYHEGLNALVGRLRQQNYSHVRQAIINNDEAALGFTGHMSNGVASDLAVWVHGNRDIAGASSYINNILSRAGAAALSASTTTSMGPNVIPDSSDTSANPKDTTGSTGNLLNFLPGWTDNPVRVLKLIVGVMLIGLAIFMIAQPEAIAIAKIAAI